MLADLARRERRVALAGLLALTAGAVALSGGTAFGYWRTSGSGDGAAATTTGYAGATVTATAATTTTLLRPGAGGDLAVAVSNTSSAPVSVTAFTTNAAGATGCTTPALTGTAPSSYRVGGTTVTLPVTVPAGATTTFTLVGAVSMAASSSDCQGAQLSVPVTVDWTS